MIDVAWMGRELARNPIKVKSYRRIEHDAKWRGLKDRAVFAATCIVGALAAWGTAYFILGVTP